MSTTPSGIFKLRLKPRLKAYLFVKHMLDENIGKWLGQVFTILVPGNILQRKVLRSIFPFLVDVAASNTNKCFMITLGYPNISIQADLKFYIL